MEEKKIPERREYPRVKITSLVVIKCDILVNISNTQKREFHTYTQNISEGGINVTLEEDLHSSTMVELKLYLRGRLKPTECKGRVAWSKVISPKLVEPRIFSIGIEFIELDDVSREDIKTIAFCL
jgi:c-di-GMP-binding flagellar brake protein YcgR